MIHTPLDNTLACKFLLAKAGYTVLNLPESNLDSKSLQSWEYIVPSKKRQRSRLLVIGPGTKNDFMKVFLFDNVRS